MEQPIAIALPKGRLFAEAVALFEAIGVTGLEAFRDSRRLIVEDGSGRYRFLALRDADVPTYVEHGAADLGVVGKDQLLEHGRDLYEPLDLEIGACRLALAAPEGAEDPRRLPSPRIATKYAALASRYFLDRGVPCEVVRLSGSVELAPRIGLADGVVDLVQTGETLRRHGLLALDTVLDVTSRLVVNRAALKLKVEEVRAFIARLEVVVG